MSGADVLRKVKADGVQGPRKIKDCGGCTIAQDEASCAVLGMPAMAFKLGAAEHVEPLQQIPKLLVQLAGSSCGKGKPQECIHDHRSHNSHEAPGC